MDADRCVIAISNVRPVPIQSLPKFLSSFTNVDGVATRTGNQVDEGTGLASEMAMDWSRFRLQLNQAKVLRHGKSENEAGSIFLSKQRFILA